ncbi:unnamed protein product [Ectocarpus sp. CCAP 1310/34]|nr:unnamed protein product [Ectocarpus sp. CCAP 1310/34]
MQHFTDGMVDIHNIRRCAHEDCVKHPTYGVPGTRKAEFCAPHALDGMVSGSCVLFLLVNFGSPASTQSLTPPDEPQRRASLAPCVLL